MITVYGYVALMQGILAILIVWTLCVDATRKWEELKAAVRRDLKPEGRGET